MARNLSKPKIRSRCCRMSTDSTTLYQDNGPSGSYCSSSAPFTNLNFEANRLQTFQNWPIQSPVDGSRLAKAGFYYTGEDDKVVCFSCKGEIKNWKFGDSPIGQHRTLFPHCDFVNNRSTNVHLPNFSLKGVPDLPNSVLNQVRCDTIEHHAQNDDVFKLAVLQNGLNGTVQPNVVDIEDMKDEVNRRSTYEHGWPVTFVDPDDLARAGLFYEGQKDRVKCAFCFGVLSSWMPGDDPFAEHKSKFPFCPFVASKTGRGRSPQLVSNGGVPARSYDECGMYDHHSVPENGFKPNLPEFRKLGIQIHRGPQYREQASVEARLRTFKSWPSSIPVKPEDLAEAGFYYIGLDDSTKCFYCNGGLRDWKLGDDPWKEHARWFPHCGFLRLNKSSNFIESCAPENAAKNGEITPTTAGKLAQAAYLGKPKMSVTNLHRCATFPPGKNATPTAIFPSIMVNSFANGPRRGSCIENMQANSQDSKKTPESEAKQSAKLPNGIDTMNEEGRFLCKICLDREVGVVFLPCGHLLACTQCAPGLEDCPVCRQVIKGTVRTFFS